MNNKVIIQSIKHSIVYRNDAEFCSWPFNGGMWKISSTEALIAFMNIECDYFIPQNLKHHRVETFGKILTSRTIDGGMTWESPKLLADNIKLADSLHFGKQARYTTPLDFSNPYTLLSCWCTPNSDEANCQAWYKLSADAGHTWGEAVMLNNCRIFPRIQGRPSYIVRSDGTALLFLTARAESDPYDRPVVYSSFDGGCSFYLHSLMPSSGQYRMICPSPVLLTDGRILAAVRCKPSLESAWDELYESCDGGRTWKLKSRINDHGDTVSLVKLDDGRLFAVYGWRRPSFGLRARVSDDEGISWSDELILRDDGGSWDLGYPRAVEMGNGKILVSYYHNLLGDPMQQSGGVRHIAATIVSL